MFYLKTDGNLKFIFLARSLSTFTKNHPDWFKKDANGNIAKNVFGLDIWDFNNNQFRSWWVNMMVNDWILKFDLDGLRLDLEPNVSNFSEIWSRVRQLAQTKRKRCGAFFRKVGMVTEFRVIIGTKNMTLPNGDLAWIRFGEG